MFRNSLRLLGIVALAAAIGLPVSASAQGNSGGGNSGGGNSGGGNSGGGPDWGAFQGLGPDGTAVVGNDKSVVAVSPGDYPSDDGNSTSPTWASVFPDGVPEPTDLTGIGGNETEVHPILVVDTDFEMKGTSLFVGVIVIRNCGSIRMAGNPNVYGAIIIDAVDAGGNACTQPYDPFAGAGTPAVRFVGGPGSGGSGVGTDKRGLTIWNERFQ